MAHGTGVETLVAGGPDADFASFVVARQGSLLRTAYLLTGDQQSAEDLVQTALAKLYLSLGRLRDTDHMDAYVRRILINEHISWWRRAWRRRETVANLDDFQPADASRPIEDMVERTALWPVVLALPPRQCVAIVLRFYEDLSEAQTAELMRCSVGTVKSQTSRGLAALRAALASEEAPA